MSDQTTTTEPTTDQNPDPAGLRKQLQERADRIAELEKKNAAYERAAIFDQAGVPKDGAAKWFRNGYDGELTVDAIKAAAQADGLIQAPPPPPPDTDPAEQDAHRVADDVTATPPPPPSGLEDGMRAAAARGPEELDRFMEANGLS